MFSNISREKVYETFLDYQVQRMGDYLAEGNEVKYRMAEYEYKKILEIAYNWRMKQ